MFVLLSTFLASAARAQTESAPAPDYDEVPTEDAEGSGNVWSYDESPSYESMTRARPGLDSTRGSTTVTREQMELRLPRSAPDALRYEPGVFVQQTSQAQGSAFIRGRTGQQTVMLFDGVRMNNSLYRQGPNQYFFTIDSRTIERIDVLRGSASTRFGSDAIAGVIAASPIDPRMDPTETGVAIRPRIMGRFSSADMERGGRVQLDGQIGPRTGFVGGFGYRETEFLRSGGVVLNPRDGELPEVPRFDDDGKTQLGTGFSEYTSDLRLVHRISPDARLTVAYYDYRQRDAPRTDQCPAPFAPYDDCLVYEEQDRQIAYAAFEGRGEGAARSYRATLSWQKQHERRAQNRPSLFSINGGRDDVNTFGATLQMRTDLFRASDNLRWLVRYGADAYHDRVTSVAWLEFTDVDVIRSRSRGQYLDGSSYTWGGAYGEVELQPWTKWAVRAGSRLGIASALADADTESGTEAVDATWVSPVANIGAEYWANDWLTFTASVDQGFRAPNLDDLTSRQQTGPGFQLENAALSPERSLTSEIGARARSERVTVDLWVYRMAIREGIARAARDAEDCPQNTAQCAASWSRFQLVNTPGISTVHGVEGGVEVEVVTGLKVRGTLAWSVGSQRNLQPRPTNPDTPYDERVPLSRIPPLNGTGEVTWRHPSGVWLGGALRWATMQDRLAPSDQSDRRIPIGGTPGFITADLRAGYRFQNHVTAGLVFENLTDAAYRYHGSSVNGAGRSISINLEAGW
jgi:iron complex outermembrane receptor protein/hemoglobin/transferrin/lactoferrin receptor protein